MAGQPPEQDDGVGCTDEVCNEDADAIKHIPNDAHCDNGEFCDGAETCDVVSDCQPGTPPVIDDGIDCTDDSCSEGTDFVDHLPNNTLCEHQCQDGWVCDPNAAGADPNTGCDSSAASDKPRFTA